MNSKSVLKVKKTCRILFLPCFYFLLCFTSNLYAQKIIVKGVSSSGQPGEESSIQIRDIVSLAGINEPLFVVDGIPQVGNLELSSNEIETIDVLKDAGSTVVYRVQAAGVILITTKRGKEGSVKVTFTSSYGIQCMGKGLPLMSIDEQLYFNNVQLYYFNGFVPNICREAWLNNDNSFTDYVVVANVATQKHDLKFMA